MAKLTLTASTEALDESVVRQRSGEFVLFAAMAPETREVVHLSLYPSTLVIALDQNEHSMRDVAC
jgi:hypothetical protein